MRTRLLLTAMIAATLLAGGEGCPLDVDRSPAGGADTAQVEDFTDLAAGGALWRVTFDDALQLTLDTGEQTAAAEVAFGSAVPIALLGRTIVLADFCLRGDVVCPHQLLPPQTSLLQTGAAFDQILVGIAPRGPLAALTARPVVIAQLKNIELTAPLAASGDASDPCQLLPASAITATVLVDETPADAGAQDAGADGGAAVDGLRAQRLRGLVTVAYSGACLLVGGTGDVELTDTVEISGFFTALRQ